MRGRPSAAPAGGAAPPVTSPRSLSARRRAASSWNAVAGGFLDGLSRFSRRAWPPARAACLRSSPWLRRLRRGRAVARPARGFGCLGGFRRLALRPRLRRRASSASLSFLVLRFVACFLLFLHLFLLAWRSARCALARFLLARRELRRGDAAAAGATGAGASSTSAAAGVGAVVALTNTRFLRTSTWIVRALPVAVGRLDLGGLLARQRDLLLLRPGRRAACAGSRAGASCPARTACRPASCRRRRRRRAARAARRPAS